MRHLAVVAVLLSAFSACTPGDTWTNRTELIEPGPPVPEHLLRQPADFRLYDPAARKEFFLYLYEDEAVKADVVTVVNYNLPETKDRRPRLATREEHDYAIALFIQEWRSHDDRNKLRYFNHRHTEDMDRRATLIDAQIVYKKKEIEALDEIILSLEADLVSRQATGTYAAGDKQLSLAESGAVQAELKRKQRQLLLAHGQLMILEYLRAHRDAQYAKLVEVFVSAEVKVADIVPSKIAPEILAQDVRKFVAPGAWGRPEASISISPEGVLSVTQTRDVILQVRDYVDQRRASLLAPPVQK
jgi:hypothetical protein